MCSLRMGVLNHAPSPVGAFGEVITSSAEQPVARLDVPQATSHMDAGFGGRASINVEVVLLSGGMEVDEEVARAGKRHVRPREGKDAALEAGERSREIAQEVNQDVKSLLLLPRPLFRHVRLFGGDLGELGPLPPSETSEPR